MNNTATKSPMIAFVELASKYWISQALNVAAKLGIADFLIQEAKTVDELAQATNSHASSLYRLLRCLASVGVFTEVEPYRFGLTPIAEYLRSDNPYSLRDQPIMHCEDWHWRTTGAMFDAVKTGKPAINHLFKVNSYWEYLVQHPESQALFDKVMLASARNFYSPFVKTYDFSNCTKLVDVAGGRGSLLASILKINPHMKGILFDMPQTVEEAGQFLEKEGVLDRCERIGGNMFESVPKSGDIYTISYIFIDWDDESIIKVLKNIRNAIAENGKLLVLDAVVPPGDEYSWIKWVDLEEMTLSYGGPRTESEFTKVFQAGGFTLSRILTMDTPCSVIELIPA
ncbi:methyltransferase [Aerosakkonema funiforme]|uniref:methyltransferase n=1 Tax=Aerosakkonema funiforme TaxID=1246630 RepID=UPI0035BA1D95